MGLVQDVVRFAAERGLDLFSRIETVPVARIETVDPLNFAKAERIRGAFASGRWPGSLPLVVVASNVGEGYEREGYVLLDGHHRLAAAEMAGMREIPAVVLSYAAYQEVADEFDIPRLEYISILSEVDPVVAGNLRARKRRS